MIGAQRPRPFSTSSNQLDQGPSFFVPLDGAAPAEQRAVYGRLREAAGEAAERSPRARLIYRLRCRFDGRDRTVEVGKRVPGGKHTVAAIFDVGGDDRYLIYAAAAPSKPLLWLGKRSVYEVMEFS